MDGHPFTKRVLILSIMITWTIIFVSCTHPSAPASTESPDKVATTPTDTFLTLKGKKTTPKKTSKSATSEKPLSHKPIVLTSGTYDSKSLTEDSLKMEAIYQDMLAPIASLKTSDPKTYWFIVSWLNTAYRTPNWRNYSNYPAWRLKTKKKGLDCSGFTRVMQDRIFGRRVRGGSQGILKTQCKPVKRSDLIKGDLVFFRAPHAKNDRIVHMGVYLMDGFFVHATSKKSASDGKGLMISSLDEVNWAAEYVTGGQIIEK